MFCSSVTAVWCPLLRVKLSAIEAMGSAIFLFSRSSYKLFSKQLSWSKLPHEGLAVDLLLGADCSPELYCHHYFHNSIAPSDTMSICSESFFFCKNFPILVLVYPASLKLDPLPAGMLSCCSFCSGKYQSPCIECLPSPLFLSSGPSELSC